MSAAHSVPPLPTAPSPRRASASRRGASFLPSVSPRPSRRTVLGLAGALGAVGLSACATSGAPGADPSEAAAETSPENPFGLEGGELNGFVFDGGSGVPHLDLVEELLLEKHPEVTADIVRTEDLSTLQPQFVNGTPPDLFQNSGAGSLDITSLRANDQLASLEDLLAAPSWDDPEVTVEESLNPGVREAGTVDGELVGLNTVQYAWGIWRDAALFEDKGWEWPTTWDELMSLSADIKAEGIYPWAFTGMHANYFDEGVFVPLAAKIGGQEVWKAVDDLEEGAWQQDAIREAAESVLQLRTDDLILPGVAQMTHIQAQTAWLNHEAALIPVGAWLENEMKSAIPDGFRMTAAALPSPDPALADLTPNNPGAGWYVPAAAANRPAAFEFLRALLSKEAAQNYAAESNSVTMVAGAHDDQELSAAFTTITEMIDRSNQVEPWQVVKYPTWYPSMAEETRAALMALLLDDLDVDGFLSRCQKKADEIAKDDAIAKQTR